MQQRVKKKQTSSPLRMYLVFLKILAFLMVSLIVSCSFNERRVEKGMPLQAGDYFGGNSSAFWPSGLYVPDEIKNNEKRLSSESVQ